MPETEQAEEEAEELPEEYVEDPNDFFTDNQAKETIFTHRGQEIKIKYKPVTRGMKYQAMEKAALAYMQDNPDAEDVRPLPSVLERELVNRCIDWWNLPKHPSIGWELITDDALADKILDRTGIKDAISQPTEGNPEVERAKNS